MTTHLDASAAPGPGSAGENSPWPPGQENSPPTAPPGRLHVARAELVLAREARWALRTVPLKPDPLQGLAAAAGQVRPELGDRIDVCLDLLPATQARMQHLRRRTAAAAEQDQHGSTGWLATLGATLREMWDGDTGDRRRTHRTARAGRILPTADPAIVGKLATVDPVFSAQLLLRAQSEIPDRPQALLKAMLAAFDVWSGENWWRVAGLNLGPVHLGADSPLYRRRFDRRFRTGRFRASHGDLLTTGELAGLLKPPTKHCQNPHVARSGGLVPAPPRGLPTYRPGQSGVVPLGYITGPDGRERLVGQALADLLFSFRVGKAGYGKTELALAQAIALGRAGNGLWFLDPHADGWRRAQPYLCDSDALLDRLWEIDLTVRGDHAMLAGWNPLSMQGQTREHIEDRVDAVVTAISSALSWGDTANRAKTILTKACQTLCELGLRLPDDAAPTIFQIRTLLSNEDWRAAVIEHLPPDLRTYWTQVFPRYPADSTPTVLNAIERIDASRTLSAFLGSPRSSYDVRRAMDTGQIVVVCPPGSGEASRLVTGLLIYDLFRAGRSRADIVDHTQRRRFDAFIDELSDVDGASKGYLAKVLEQLRKFRVHLHAMTQHAGRLTQPTRDALLQNQSLLCATAGALDASKIITRQWAKQVEPGTVTMLPKYHHVVSATIDGQASTPFKIRGPEVTELFADVACPEGVGWIPTAVNRNLRRRPIGDTLADLAELDDRILDLLDANAGAITSPGPARPSTNGPTRGRATGRGVALDAPAHGEAASPPAGNNVVPFRRPDGETPYTSTID